MINFALLLLLAVTLFDVPVKGGVLALASAALLYVTFSTGFGLFCSTFTRSQIAAIFVTLLGTMIPAIQFAGMTTPVSSLEGFGAAVGRVHPAAHFLTISRGAFNKGLGFADMKVALLGHGVVQIEKLAIADQILRVGLGEYLIRVV